MQGCCDTPGFLGKDIPMLGFRYYLFGAGDVEVGLEAGEIRLGSSKEIVPTSGDVSHAFIELTSVGGIDVSETSNTSWVGIKVPTLGMPEVLASSR